MLKFKGAVCLLLVGMLAGTSFGAAVKIRSFVGCGPTPDADAMAILAYASGSDTTQIQLITDLNIVTTVRVIFTRGDGASVATIFDTDINGSGTIHLSIDGDWSDSNIVIEDIVSSNIRYAAGQNPKNSTALTCSN